MPIRLTLLVCIQLASFCSAQELIMNDGRVLAGEVIKVAANRIHFRDASKRLLRLETRSVKYFRAKTGERTSYPAELVKQATAAPQQAILAQLEAGQEPGVIALRTLSKDCSQELLAALKKLIVSKSEVTRLSAGKALAMAGTKETTSLALKLVLEDSKAKVRREVALSLMTETAVAALRLAKMSSELNKGLVAKDKQVRLALSWIGVKLGMKTAIPVLEPFCRDADHHIREEVAVLLAEQGSKAGLKELIKMAGRKESPALKANRDASPSLIAKLKAADLRERIYVCELLGQLKDKKAKGVLKRLSKAKEKELAATANAALAKISAAQDG